MSAGIALLGIGSLAVLAAPALAQEPAPPTAPPPVEPPPAPTPPAVPPPTALPPGVIAPGVKVAGVDVGGLTRAAAKRAVLTQHVAPRRKPVIAVYRGKRIPISPVAVGYVANVDYALKAALLYGRQRPVPATGITIPLRQTVNTKKLTAVLESRVAKRYDIAPRDAAFTLRGTTPRVRAARPGRALKVAGAVRVLRQGITARTRNAYTLPSARVKPAVTRLRPAIIIDRANFRLTLWRHGGKSQRFPIAVGKPGHATPTGNFHVIQMQKNPTWYPPNSPWAAGLGPVEPGAGNPLGTRWIGISSPAIGMHGTPSPGTIGTRASHGCIRMYIRDAERLYDQVQIGTPVYIR